MQRLKRIVYTYILYFDHILNDFAFFYEVYFITFTKKMNFNRALRDNCDSGYRYDEQYD